MSLRNYEELKETSNGNRSTLLPCLASAFCFALIGAQTSYATYIILEQISASYLFSHYLSFFFTIVGFIVIFIGWRSITNKAKLLLYGIVLVLSGGICYMIEQNWFIGLSTYTKVGLYTLIGSQSAFSLTFNIRDAANYVADLCHKRAFIDKAAQINLIVYSSIIIGIAYGFVFGLKDIVKVAEQDLHLNLVSVDHFILPLGFIVGGISGFLNEKIRQQGFE